MTTILFYTTDETLLDDINSNSELSDLIGEDWPNLPQSVREVFPSLVYEVSLVVPDEVDFPQITDFIDHMTGGICLIVQAETA